VSAKYSKLLRDPRWKAFRDVIVGLDEGTCAHCGKVHRGGRGMHVHHKQYRKGLLPWEYNPNELETLCAGCHAAEHGILPPKVGWEFLYESDMEDVCENCSVCKTDIRYVFTIWHDDWGSLDVGTVCCDRMTGTKIASEYARLQKRKERFVGSARWSSNGKSLGITQGGIRVYIYPKAGGYRVCMKRDGETVFGKRTYRHLQEAKGRIFDVINDGSALRAIGTDHHG
jgi:hypothetical protein